MSKLKSNLIKLSAVVFALSLSLAIAFMPKVSAQEVSEFSIVQSATIRNEEDGLVGLKFQSTVNTAWLTENDCEKYTFGTLKIGRASCRERVFPHV